MRLSFRARLRLALSGLVISLTFSTLSFAQSANITLVLQDFGANSISGINNIDIYSVPTSGLLSGSATHLASYPAFDTYISSNGAISSSNLLSLPLTSGTGDFAVANIDTISGLLVSFSATNAGGAGSQPLRTLSTCQTISPYLITTHYTANNSHGLSVLDPSSGSVSLNLFSSNAELPWANLPIDQDLACSPIDINLYQAVELGQINGLPSYYVRNYHIDLVQGQTSSNILSANSGDAITSIDVRADGTLILLRFGTTHYIEIRDPVSFAVLGTNQLPTNSIPISGASVYDAASDRLYIAAQIISGTSLLPDVLYFDLFNLNVGSLNINGLFSGHPGAQIATIALQ